MYPPLQRMTKQRVVILNTLNRLRTHPTADELYDVVRRELPHVSLGTIYRNLDLLARSGHIRKVDTGGSQARFDAEREPHHHVRCQGCGRVDDVKITPGTRIQHPPLSEHGFEILDYRIAFEGRCPECRKSAPASEER